MLTSNARYFFNRFLNFICCPCALQKIPFIIKAGKALNERKVEVRVQFRTQPGYFAENGDEMRNEFVMRVQPNEAMYMKMVVKKPGLDMDYVMSELNLTYGDRHASLLSSELRTIVIVILFFNAIAVFIAIFVVVVVVVVFIVRIDNNGGGTSS